MNRREMIAASIGIGLGPWLRAQTPKDDRPIKTLNDYFPLSVPKSLDAWKARAERVREQILVATGLWPMPERVAIHATIHSPIHREHYTIEKVFFASRPGHYVTGNLYRPKNASGRRPGVLFAHGHWDRGRFMETNDSQITTALETKAEKTRESAKYHMQAACATLARRGCVVFAYDMIGYADSTAIGHVARSGVPHPNGFADLEGELRLQSLMGLQTWNSLRAIDFLAGLPDVDAAKIGMTGASGGGTQTFIAAALDERIRAAVPAVMVSTAMQGGCVCENCSLLRVGTGNVEFAALIAPRPLALTCANDWTREFMTKGFPELQQVYALYGKAENIAARAWLEYPHNYNQPAREFMYAFFAKHLDGREETVSEPPFVPVPPKDLSVFDADHPRPKDEVNAQGLRKRMMADDAAWIDNLQALDADKKPSRRSLIESALRAIICDELPKSIVVRAGPKESKMDDATVHRAWLGRHEETDALPTLGAFGPKFDGSRAVIWIHPDGKQSLIEGEKFVPGVRTLLDGGYAIISADLYGTGDLRLPKPFPVNSTYAGFTFGYNRSLLAQRVHDILTLVAFATTSLKIRELRLVGWASAGSWAAVAHALAGNAITRAIYDLNQFDFDKVTSVNDEMMLPGALKYGGLSMILSHSSAKAIVAHNAPALKLSQAITRDTKPWPQSNVIAWLMKPAKD